MKCEQSVNHGHHGNEGEQPSADLSNFIAKVEKANRETTEDNGKVEPREKGTLVSEEDFGLDTGWKGDALAW